MGQQSRMKAARREYARQHPELIGELRNQYRLLVDLGESFDAGRPLVALPLATAIRVLVHETRTSHALLVQLAEMERLRFLDSAVPLNPANLILTHCGLATLQMKMGEGGTWVPHLVVGAPPPGARNSWEPFDTWWTRSVVVRDSHGITWSRCQLVLDAANKEGGAHVDPHRPEDLRALQNDNSMGWTYSDPIVGAEQPLLNGPLLPCIRQIGHELRLRACANR